MQVCGEAFFPSIFSAAARAAGLRDQPRDGQALPVFPRGVSHVAEFALLAFTLAVEAAVGIGRALMRVVLACRAVEIRPVAVCIALRLEAFVASPRLDQRAIDGEMLV